MTNSKARHSVFIWLLGVVAVGGGMTVRAPIDEAYVFPLSYAQERLWFLDQLVPGNPFYNVASATRLRARLDTETLVRAVNEVVRRHEALRTTFRVIDGVPMQVVAPELTIRVAGYDLGGVPVVEREAEAVHG